MSTVEHSFLFSSLDSKQPRTARKVHIRRLNDILQLCLLRKDFVRARRAWTILIRCNEVKWKNMWNMAVLLLAEQGQDDAEPNEERIAFLSTMMRQHPDERESILKELVLQLIRTGMYRRALDELDLYLPSFPYQDNPVLHVYAGLVALYVAQPKNAVDVPLEGQKWDASLLRDAQTHFDRAKAIDPNNVVAAVFSQQLPGITQQQGRDSTESDDEDMKVDDKGQRRKRVRT